MSSNAGSLNPLIKDAPVAAPNNKPALTIIAILIIGGMAAIVLISTFAPPGVVVGALGQVIAIVALGVPIIVALNKVDEVHKTVNSKMSEMLALQANASFAAGIVEGARAADAISAVKSLQALKEAGISKSEAVQAAIIEVKRP
jgi:signal recognition particle receptor subunit beta